MRPVGTIGRLAGGAKFQSTSPWRKPEAAASDRHSDRHLSGAKVVSGRQTLNISRQAAKPQSNAKKKKIRARIETVLGCRLYFLGLFFALLCALAA
jgi:hypothetical protein